MSLFSHHPNSTATGHAQRRASHNTHRRGARLRNRPRKEAERIIHGYMRAEAPRGASTQGLTPRRMLHEGGKAGVLSRRGDVDLALVVLLGAALGPVDGLVEGVALGRRLLLAGVRHAC